MGWAGLKSVEYSDEEKYDRMAGPSMEPPDYPPGLCFMICKDDLVKAGAEGGEPNDTMRFSAMGEVTSVFQGREDCRIEVSLNEFAGEDGKFFDLACPACICLCGPELEKIELSGNAERGDMIHVIGTARLESMSSTEWGGDMATLQVVEMTYEDESEESREG